VFGMSLAEILLILVVVLLVLGPERLPEIARMMGKGMREIRRASNMFRDTFMLDEQQAGGRRTDQMMPAPDPTDGSNDASVTPSDDRASDDALEQHAASLSAFDSARLVDLPHPAPPDVSTYRSTELYRLSTEENAVRSVALDPPVPASVW